MPKRKAVEFESDEACEAESTMASWEPMRETTRLEAGRSRAKEILLAKLAVLVIEHLTAEQAQAFLDDSLFERCRTSLNWTGRFEVFYGTSDWERLKHLTLDLTPQQLPDDIWRKVFADFKIELQRWMRCNMAPHEFPAQWHESALKQHNQAVDRWRAACVADMSLFERFLKAQVCVHGCDQRYRNMGTIVSLTGSSVSVLLSRDGRLEEEQFMPRRTEAGEQVWSARTYVNAVVATGDEFTEDNEDYEVDIYLDMDDLRKRDWKRSTAIKLCAQDSNCDVFFSNPLLFCFAPHQPPDQMRLASDDRSDEYRYDLAEPYVKTCLSQVLIECMADICLRFLFFAEQA